MGLKTHAIAGADDYFTNISGNNYLPSIQGPTSRCKLFKLIVSVPSSVGADRTVWIYDLSAGTTGSNGPVTSLHVVSGTTATLDGGASGMVFKNGIYLVVATNDVPNANTAPTVGANNDAMIKCDWR